MLKKLLQKLLPTKKNHAHTKGEKKIHAQKIGQPQPSSSFKKIMVRS